MSQLQCETTPGRRRHAPMRDTLCAATQAWVHRVLYAAQRVLTCTLPDGTCRMAACDSNNVASQFRVPTPPDVAEPNVSGSLELRGAPSAELACGHGTMQGMHMRSVSSYTIWWEALPSYQASARKCKQEPRLCQP